VIKGTESEVWTRAPPDFLRNPSVHSLSVTLGNHTVLGNPPYNDHCPAGHTVFGQIADEMLDRQVNIPREERSSAAAEPESALIWRLVLASINKRF